MNAIVINYIALITHLHAMVLGVNQYWLFVI